MHDSDLHDVDGMEPPIPAADEITNRVTIEFTHTHHRGTYVLTSQDGPPKTFREFVEAIVSEDYQRRALHYMMDEAPEIKVEFTLSQQVNGLLTTWKKNFDMMKGQER